MRRKKMGRYKIGWHTDTLQDRENPYHDTSYTDDDYISDAAKDYAYYHHCLLALQGSFASTSMVRGRVEYRMGTVVSQAHILKNLVMVNLSNQASTLKKLSIKFCITTGTARFFSAFNE